MKQWLYRLPAVKQFFMRGRARWNPQWPTGKREGQESEGARTQPEAEGRGLRYDRSDDQRASGGCGQECRKALLGVRGVAGGLGDEPELQENRWDVRARGLLAEERLERCRGRGYACWA